MIRLTKPVIPESAIALAVEVLRSGNLVQGKYVSALEAKLAEYLGVRECVCVTSGTAALHLAVLALDLPRASEAVVPGFTFPATANAAEQAGIRTILADISRTSCCIDPKEIEKAISPATRLLIPVHEFGQAADMDPIMEIAEKHRLAVIEDAACALGTEYHGKKCGTIGDIGCFSFHPRKAITTGEGGAIVTNDPQIAAKLRTLRNHGIRISDGKNDFVCAGLNYRMTDFQAALALEQLAGFEEQIRHRRKVAALYAEALKEISWITVPSEFPNRRMVYQTYHVLLDGAVDRTALIAFLRERGIESNYGAQALSRLSYYRSHVVSGLTYGESEYAYAHGLALPMGSHVTEDEITKIASTLKLFQKK